MEAKLIKRGHSYALVLNEKLVAFAHPEDFSENDTIGKLCLDNCQAIERGFDLDELVDEEISEFDQEARIVYRRQLQESLANMFSKALELMGDKKFSEFLDKEKELGISDIKTIERIQWYYNTYFDKSQQTEWDVEVEMEKYGRCELCLKAGMWHCAHADTCGSAVEAERPKLDPEGCLILKRKA